MAIRRSEAMPRLIESLPALPFEARKDVSQVCRVGGGVESWVLFFFFYSGGGGAGGRAVGYYVKRIAPVFSLVVVVVIIVVVLLVLCVLGNCLPDRTWMLRNSFSVALAPPPPSLPPTRRFSATSCAKTSRTSWSTWRESLSW